MNYSKTVDTSLAESPFVLRPGTVCQLALLYSMHNEHEWDSSAVAFSGTYPGFVDEFSVQCTDADISDYLTITKVDNNYEVYIDIMGSGVLNLNIYYYKEDTYTVTSKSAFNDSYNTYYKDYEIRNNVVYPKTIIDLPVIEDMVQLVKYDVIYEKEQTGITFFGNDMVTINSFGLLDYNGQKEYVLRKGKSSIILPSDSELDAKTVLSNGNKVVEYDNIEWKTNYNAAYGILAYKDQLFVCTNYSLCVFDFFGDFTTPLVESVEIEGKDLTLTEDGCILVTSGTLIKKFRIKHDNVLIDTANKRIYFRELYPNININIIT